MSVLLLLLVIPQAPLPKARSIETVLNAPALRSSFFGVEVRELRSGKILYARNADKGFRPASTLKLVTTAAALDILGPDYRPITTLATAATLDREGTLRGDLYLVGGGDPLSERPPRNALAAFEEFADALFSSGVRYVEGRLVGHEGLFSGPRRGIGWTWEDLVWWYGAEVSALSLNDNCATLRILPGYRPGDPVRLETFPETSYYQIENRALTSPAGSKSDLAIERDFGANTIRLSGTHPLSEVPAELRLALEDPARFAVTVFSEVLRSRGVSVKGLTTTREALPDGVRVLATHTGMPLSETIRTVNKRSQNLHAEMLLRLIGTKSTGEGSAEAGLCATKDVLTHLGVDTTGWDLEDGSGLSTADLVTPHGLVSLLQAMDAHRDAAVFRASLPIAGVDGSLRNRMKGTQAEGRVLAKTGSVDHVAGLAGYVDARDGTRLAVAILVNGEVGTEHRATRAIDAICEILSAP